MSHNSSICVLSDGEIVYFLEEDRLSKNKHDHFPLCILYDISTKYEINEIALSGLNRYYQKPLYHKSIIILFENLFPKAKLNKKFLPFHHQTHSSISFYNSGFKKAINVVIDGVGENHKLNNNIDAFETETIQITSYPLVFKEIYKSLWTKNYKNFHKSRVYSPHLNLGRTYEIFTEYLGFNWSEAGKIMGLSSYGKTNSLIPPIYLNTRANPKIIESYNFTSKVKRKPISKEWHKDPSKTSDFIKDLCFKLQQDSQKEVGDLIEKAIQETGLKQVCCSGGYFLNCVANYYLTKRFPDIKFYFEPISSDAGTSIGAAKLAWHEKTQDTTIRPQKTLYYGPKYSKEDLLKGIQKYLA